MDTRSIKRSLKKLSPIFAKAVGVSAATSAVVAFGLFDDPRNTIVLVHGMSDFAKAVGTGTILGSCVPIFACISSKPNISEVTASFAGVALSYATAVGTTTAVLSLSH